VVAGAEVDPLGDAAVAADADRREGVEPGPLSDPAVVTDFEFPGVLDVDRRLEHHALSDLGAEEAEGLLGDINSRIRSILYLFSAAG